MALPSSDSSRLPTSSPASLESLQVHVEERTADPDLAGQVADVVTPAGQLGHDPQADRVGQGRQRLDQVVTGRRRSHHQVPSCVSNSLHMNP
jgi:hypothetical protein